MILIKLSVHRRTEIDFTHAGNKPPYARCIGYVDGTPAYYVQTDTSHRVRRPYLKALSALARWMSKNNLSQDLYNRHEPKKRRRKKKKPDCPFGGTQQKLL